MKTTLTLTLLILFISCSGSNSDKSTNPSAADLAKFTGTWAGSYSCLGGDATPDTLVIRPGDGTLDFSIIIHAGFYNPDTVSGELTEPDLAASYCKTLYANTC